MRNNDVTGVGVCHLCAKASIRTLFIDSPFGFSYDRPVSRYRMGEIVNLENLKRLVKDGESDVVEFKKSTAQLQRAGETLCAFLNGKGGRVYIGVTPSGDIRGQEVTDKTLLDISSIISQLEPSAPIDIERVATLNGKEVVILNAHPIKAYQPFTFMGRPYQRVGSATRTLPRSGSKASPPK